MYLLPIEQDWLTVKLRQTVLLALDIQAYFVQRILCGRRPIHGCLKHVHTSDHVGSLCLMIFPVNDSGVPDCSGENGVLGIEMTIHVARLGRQ